jgi:DNA-binding Lrp family transcriptional regulator
VSINSPESRNHLPRRFDRAFEKSPKTTIMLTGHISIDRRDREILEVLHYTPDATAETVAAQTRIPKATVQKRLQSLLRRKVLSKQVVIHDRVFPAIHIVGLKLDLGAIESKEKQQHGKNRHKYADLAEFACFLRNYPRAENVTIEARNVVIDDLFVLMGAPWDVLILIAASDERAILRFVVNLRKLRGVRDTATWVSFRHSDFLPEANVPDSLHRTHKG